VDGTPVDVGRTVAYKGMMLSGVPNLGLTMGYTNASWTLRADLIAEYVCRLLRHMEERGYEAATPLAPDLTDLAPLINLTSGYVARSVDALPKQGPRRPWRMYQNYARDVLQMRRGPVSDKGIRFTRVKSRTPVS
jgi:monooxygenase